MNIEVPDSTPIIEIARAFALIGMTLTNDNRGQLVAKRESLDNPKWWEKQRAINAAHAIRRAAMTDSQRATQDQQEAARAASLERGE